MLDQKEVRVERLGSILRFFDKTCSSYFYDLGLPPMDRISAAAAAVPAFTVLV